MYPIDQKIIRDISNRNDLKFNLDKINVMQLPIQPQFKYTKCKFNIC